MTDPQSPDPSRPMAPGLMVGDRYRLLRLIDDTGAQGLVWLAVDARLGRTVAVKVMRTGHVADREFLARFRAEAVAAAALSDPRLVTVHDTGLHDSVPFIVMEFVEGINLRQRLSDCGQLDVAEAVRIGTEVARALRVIHAAQLVHRDIKPENVLLRMTEGRPSTEVGAVKLTDFGIARARGSDRITPPAAPSVRLRPHAPPPRPGRRTCPETGPSGR